MEAVVAGRMEVGLWGEKESKPFLRARDFLLEFRDANILRSKSVIPRAETKWKPPPPGLFKINFDGSVFENLGWAGLGVAIRDAEGRIIAALSQKIPLPRSVDMVEALAARRAITFAHEISIFQAEVEGDSLKVISALNNPHSNRSHIGHIIQDIKCASQSMQVCFFNHVRRGGNSLAHSLAKRAVLAADLDVWLEELPPDLDDVFQIDCAQ
ncbi:uncharacterized protein LOC142615973 [Castanea sativa]|uniref:uncharacterized protein LOC142615973 n=1 Tax=Castanea sativa TaxID=21020 RepID=UPI003F64AE8A